MVLITGAMIGIVGLGWREEDPWVDQEELPRSLPAVFAVPMIILAFVVSAGVRPNPSPSLGDGLRVATYNINQGYDEDGMFSLEAVARTIEASLADVIVLQEVDAGSPLGSGIDQAEYLARRTGMYYEFMPTREHVAGIAILSRWPIIEHQSILFPTAPPLGALRVRFIDASSGRSLDTIGSQMLAGTRSPGLSKRPWYSRSLIRIFLLFWLSIWERGLLILLINS